MDDGAAICLVRLVTFLLSMPAINQRFQKAGHWIDRVLGVAMTALGIKVIAG